MSGTGVIKLETCALVQTACLCNRGTYAGKESTKPGREPDLGLARPEFGQNLQQKHGLEITETRLAMDVISLRVRSVSEGCVRERLRRKYEGEFTFDNDFAQASSKAREKSFAFVRVSY